MALYQLVQEQPGVIVQFISGKRPGVVKDVLLGRGQNEGTVLHW